MLVHPHKESSGIVLGESEGFFTGYMECLLSDGTFDEES